MVTTRGVVLVSLLAAVSCGEQKTAGDGEKDAERVFEEPATAKPAASVAEERVVDGGGMRVRDAGVAGRPAGAEADARWAQVERLLSTGEVDGARPLSKRSLSLRIALDGGGNAVFKPLRKGNGTARFEVAYSRLARHLGVERVPVAVPRAVPLARLIGHLKMHSSEIAERLAKESAVDADGMVHGAMIEWMDGIRPAGLSGGAGKSVIRRALGGEEAAAPVSARVISAMIVMDYVAGNWDRFSGGNVFVDDGDRLCLIDNNGSFYRWSDRQRARMEEYLGIVSRFSRELVSRLETLDERILSEIMEGEIGGKPILGESEIRLVLERRDEVLARIKTLREEEGDGGAFFD